MIGAGGSGKDTIASYLKKKYKAEDANNEYKTGDIVDLVSSKPLSKYKHYIVVGKK